MKLYILFFVYIILLSFIILLYSDISFFFSLGAIKTRYNTSSELNISI